MHSKLSVRANVNFLPLEPFAIPMQSMNFPNRVATRIRVRTNHNSRLAIRAIKRKRFRIAK
jgi:hypothetical protein